MGVVVRRYIDTLTIIITYPYPTSLVLAHFLQQHLNFFVHFKNVFRSCLCYFCAIIIIANALMLHKEHC